MLFKIVAQNPTNLEDIKTFLYENHTNTLSEENGFVYEYPVEERNTYSEEVPYVAFDKNNPLKKSKLVTLLKIQLGLSCNYTCSYCSQKFVERPPETNRKDIDNFMAMLESLEFDETKGLKIEFWGGEPFVYWKTFKPLAEAIKEKFSSWEREPVLSVITNGSILSKEICMWLYYIGFNVAISHDGPGQYVRGPDPFDDPDQKKIILDFYKTMKKQRRLSFNPMLNARNMSRKEIFNWFVELTGDPTVELGEGGIVDAYDDDGIENSLNTYQAHFDFRKTAFGDIFETNGQLGFKMIMDKVDGFTNNLLSHQSSDLLWQKCGMDNENVLALDLRGNVFTCQNVSAAEKGLNGEPHLSGHVTDMENVRIHTATHWSNRKECSGCPVLHLCKGACMFLDKKYWDISCNNAYSDNVALFAASLYKITGYVPILIQNDELPLHRQDVWGTLFEHKEKETRKIIPIKVVAEKTVLNDVEVFSKSRVEIVEGE
jgi:uncharacterized protein